MGLRSWIISATLLSSTVLAAAQPETPRIIQPGVPGANSKVLSPATIPTTSRTPMEADTKFMQGMIHHHQQAVEMVDLLRTHGRSKAVMKLGERIRISQTDEIKFMQQWLADRGKAVPTQHEHMTHMGHNSMDMSSMAPMPGMLTPE